MGGAFGRWISPVMSSTSKLTPTQLRFTNDGSTVTALMIASEDTLTFVGENETAPMTLEVDGGRVTGLAAPSVNTDAVNKAYVDGKLQGLSVRQAVKAASTANLDLANAVDNGKSLDGVTLATNDRILLKDQTTLSQNGIWVVQADGAPQRPDDFASDSNVAATFVFVQQGTDNEDKGFVCTNDAPNAIVDKTDGTGNLAFTQFSSAGGGGGTITEVNGTGGQINASTTSGAVTLSLPSTITQATTFSATTTVDGALALNNGFTHTANDDPANSTFTIASATGDVTVNNGSRDVFGINAAGTGTHFFRGGTFAVKHSSLGSDKFTVAGDTGNMNCMGDVNFNGPTFNVNSGGQNKFKVTGSSGDVDSVGTVTANEFVAESDRRLKQNIVPLETSAALATVAAMGPCTYQFKKTPDDQRCGVIAQELAEIAPELVKHTDKGTLAVDYNDMNAYLIGAIQALKSQVEEQADLIQRLSQQIPVVAVAAL